MDKEAKDQAKNRQAESAYVRQMFWGAKEPETESDEMGDTILGDVTNPTPVIVTQPNRSNWPLAIGLAAATAFPTAGGLAAYMISRMDNQPAEKSEFDDATVKIGLGKIEDYLKNTESNSE